MNRRASPGLLEIHHRVYHRLRQRCPTVADDIIEVGQQGSYIGAYRGHDLAADVSIEAHDAEAEDLCILDDIGHCRLGHHNPGDGGNAVALRFRCVEINPVEVVTFVPGGLTHVAGYQVRGRRGTPRTVEIDGRVPAVCGNVIDPAVIKTAGVTIVQVVVVVVYDRVHAARAVEDKQHVGPLTVLLDEQRVFAGGCLRVRKGRPASESEKYRDKTGNWRGE